MVITVAEVLKIDMLNLPCYNSLLLFVWGWFTWF